jgi:PAS domain S-box-containing protein
MKDGHIPSSLRSRSTAGVTRSPFDRSTRLDLIWIALTTSAVMTAMEFLQYSLSPQIRVWQSHAMSIFIAGISAGVAGWVLRWRRSGLEEEPIRLATAGDITQRKPAEEDFRTSGNFRLLFTDNPLPMWVFDLDTLRFLEVNAAAITHYGFSRQEFLSMSVTDIRPREDVPRFLEDIKVASRGLHRAGVWRHCKKDGSLIDVEIHAQPVPFDGRRAEMVLAADVTDRKRAEEQLARERNLLRTLIDAVPDRIFAKDTEDRVILANVETARLCRVQSPDQLLGKTSIELIPGDEGRQFAHEDEEVFSTGQAIFDRESHTTHPNGETEWFLTTKIPLRDASGEVIGLVATGRNITQRKLAEQALKEKEEKYRSLVSNIPDVVWTIDSNLNVVFISDTIERVSGFCVDEIYREGARLFLASIHPDDVGRMQAAFEALFRTGAPYDVECRIRRKNGEWIWIHDRALATYDKDGVLYADGILSNITARKKAEEATRESEEQVRLLLESTAEAIYGVDLDGNCTFANPACLRLLGYGSNQKALLGRKMHDVVHHSRADGSPLPVAECRCLQASQTGEPCHIDDEVLWRADGTSFPAEYWSYPVTRGGKLVGSVITFLDITERKRAEAELLRAKEAAEAASRAKSEFLANMSHEIRTPMNGILGMTDLALETDLNTEQREYLETVKASAVSLLTVINDILDFSKVEAGKVMLDLIDFNLRDSLEETVKSLAPAAHQKGLEIMLDVQPEVPEFMHGDPTRLRQIVVNMIGNALKFTEHGEVMLRVDAMPEGQRNGVLHFAVRDTGIGIPAEKRQLIFEAFSQADASMTRRFGGTGLGLSIATALVKLMQGRIWVESEVGRGSTFHFTAQLGKAEPPARALVGGENVDLQGLRVLVVDDNAANRRLLEKWLTVWGMKPALVGSATAAIETLREAHGQGRAYRIVLTDAQMPELDGFMLAERIKGDPELSAPIIIMLSSGGQRGDAARCKTLGIAGYLSKPVRQTELHRAMVRVMQTGSQPAQSPSLVTRHTLREEPSGGRVLLAEDNAVNQRLAVRLLEKRGYQVVVADNGKEAVTALEEQTFQFALVDIQMPYIDGLELTKIIRTKERTSGQHLPIIAMTAHARKEDREECMAAGMDSYVSKPISARELFEVINSTLTACSENDGRVSRETTVPQVVS